MTRIELIKQFVKATKEKHFLTWYRLFTHGDLRFKTHHIVFYGDAFLWTQIQSSENDPSTSILRVHALYIHPPSHTIPQSREKTSFFEHVLQQQAHAHTPPIKEIGFYTRRHPQAFMRRLNRTTPKGKPWTLDSYVITRKV